MNLSVEELLVAKETVDALLDELRLEAYLFEVQPGTEGWDVHVECAMATGWMDARFTVPGNTLAACRDDAGTRSRIREEWNQQLVACERLDH